MAHDQMMQVFSPASEFSAAAIDAAISLEVVGTPPVGPPFPPTEPTPLWIIAFFLLKVTSRHASIKITLGPEVLTQTCFTMSIIVTAFCTVSGGGRARREQA